MRFAIVIKPDGTVPFGEGLSEEHRLAMLGQLTLDGHTVQHFDKPHPIHGGVSHAVLLTGPHSKAGQDKRRAEEAQGALDLKPSSKSKP